MNVTEAKNVLEQFLKTAGFEIDDILLEEGAEQEYYFNIMSINDAVHLIGRNGDTLYSMQHLIKSIFRSQSITEEGDNVRIDVDSYRQRQEDNVVKMAETRAKQVADSGRNSILPPMSPFFRRLVHMHVKKNYPSLLTSSQGTGNYRAVCISAGESSNDQETNNDPYATIDF